MNDSSWAPYWRTFLLSNHVTSSGVSQPRAVDDTYDCHLPKAWWDCALQHVQLIDADSPPPCFPWLILASICVFVFLRNRKSCRIYFILFLLRSACFLRLIGRALATGREGASDGLPIYSYHPDNVAVVALGDDHVDNINDDLLRILEGHQHRFAHEGDQQPKHHIDGDSSPVAFKGRRRESSQSRHHELECPFFVKGHPCEHRGTDFHGHRSIADLHQHLNTAHGLLYCTTCSAEFPSTKQYNIHHGRLCEHGKDNCTACNFTGTPESVCRRPRLVFPSANHNQNSWPGRPGASLGSWPDLTHMDKWARCVGRGSQEEGPEEVQDRWLKIYELIFGQVDVHPSKYRFVRNQNEYIQLERGHDIISQQRGGKSARSYSLQGEMSTARPNTGRSATSNTFGGPAGELSFEGEPSTARPNTLGYAASSVSGFMMPYPPKPWNINPVLSAQGGLLAPQIMFGPHSNTTMATSHDPSFPTMPSNASGPYAASSVGQSNYSGQPSTPLTQPTARSMFASHSSPGFTKPFQFGNSPNVWPASDNQSFPQMQARNIFDSSMRNNPCSQIPQLTPMALQGAQISASRANSALGQNLSHEIDAIPTSGDSLAEAGSGFPAVSQSALQAPADIQQMDHSLLHDHGLESGIMDAQPMTAQLTSTSQVDWDQTRDEILVLTQQLQSDLNAVQSTIMGGQYRTERLKESLRYLCSARDLLQAGVSAIEDVQTEVDQGQRI